MRRALKAVGGGVALLLVLLAGTVLFLALRRHRTATLPAPGGIHAVGRIVAVWTDSARRETLGGSGGPRRLAVWIWYPAQAGGTPAPYLPPAWERAHEAERSGPAALLFQATTAVRSHARADAPPAAATAPFPVLVFEPGMGPSVSDYTSLAEALASRGYVVIGVNPTYSATLTVLDGEAVAPTARGTLPENGTPAQLRRAADALIRVWAADDRFAMDEATRLDRAADGAFAGRLDTLRFGLWGHSFGGAAALEACREDARCAGAADLDGWPFGTVARTGLDRPVLYVASESTGRGDPAARDAAREIDAILRNAPGSARLTLRGARHFDFTDAAALFSPALHLVGLLGPIDGARALERTADALSGFFARVSGRPATVLPPAPAGVDRARRARRGDVASGTKSRGAAGRDGAAGGRRRHRDVTPIVATHCNASIRHGPWHGG